MSLQTKKDNPPNEKAIREFNDELNEESSKKPNRKSNGEPNNDSDEESSDGPDFEKFLNYRPSDSKEEELLMAVLGMDENWVDQLLNQSGEPSMDPLNGDNPSTITTTTRDKHLKIVQLLLKEGDSKSNKR